MKYTLPAGKYYIGDPCYVFEDASWDKICDHLEDGIHDYLSKPFFMGGTKHGDGCYYDQEGNRYPVDAGVLGAVPMEIMEKEIHLKLGRIIDFPDGLEIEYEDGHFDFGGIIIETGYEDEDEI